jgi:hypothetical protein
MNSFDKIKALVEPKLTSHQNDLNYDKDLLDGYEGPFIHASRCSGTNLRLLDSRYFRVYSEDNAQTMFKKQLDDTRVFLLNPQNNYFLYGNNETLIEISRDKVEKIINDFEKNILSSKSKKVEALNIRAIAYDLFIFVHQDGKKCQQKLKKEWENPQNLSSGLQKLKQYFDNKMVLDLAKEIGANSFSIDDVTAGLFKIYNATEEKKNTSYAAQKIAELTASVSTQHEDLNQG